MPLSTIGSNQITDGAIAVADVADGSITTAKTDQTTLGTVEASKHVTANSSGDVLFPDNERLKFGSGGDLHIYHNGSNSYIDEQTGSGALILKSNIFSFRSATDDAQLAKFVEDGVVELYHNGTKKFETDANGVLVDVYSQGNQEKGIFFRDGFTSSNIYNLSILTYDHSQSNNNPDGLSINGYDGISFCTNSGTRNERMRIEQNGNVIVGSSTFGADNSVSLAAGGTVTIAKAQSAGTTHLFVKNGGNTVGSITSNTTTTFYNTSSDYRLKENVEDMSDATARLKKLQPRRFNFKADADTTVDGFLAHEVSSIVPEAITGTKDGEEKYTDDEGKEKTQPVYQGIDQSKLVPLLTKALQEAFDEIDILKTKVKALETA